MPTVAVLSTGDELVEPRAETLGRGQVLCRMQISDACNIHQKYWTPILLWWLNNGLSADSGLKSSNVSGSSDAAAMQSC